MNSNCFFSNTFRLLFIFGPISQVKVYKKKKVNKFISKAKHNDTEKCKEITNNQLYLTVNVGRSFSMHLLLCRIFFINSFELKHYIKYLFKKRNEILFDLINEKMYLFTLVKIRVRIRIYLKSASNFQCSILGKYIYIISQEKLKMLFIKANIWWKMNVNSKNVNIQIVIQALKHFFFLNAETCLSITY